MNENNKNIIVMPVQEQEYDQWLVYWLNYQQFYKVQLSQEITSTDWKRFFAADIPVYCAVAKEGQEILGFVHYVFHDSTWAVNEYCYLEDLFVAPESRGMQVGKRLIEYVKKQALDRQCARLYWHTQETNLTAHRLYDWVAEKPGVIEYRISL